MSPEQEVMTTPSSLVDTTRATTADSEFILQKQPDVIRYIFGYLDGQEVVRLRLLNRFAASFLLSCVRNLDVSIPQLQSLLVESRDQPAHLKAFVSLEELSLKHEARDLKTTRFHSKLPFYAANHGELTVWELAAVLRHRSHPRLRKLSLNSTFVNTKTVNGAGAILQALVAGACPNLRVLDLGGNCLGDWGASEVAAVLRSGKCRELKHLDLRGNYIGEKGFDEVARSIEEGAVPKLNALCMGCNIANNKAVSSMSRALGSGMVRNLKFLGFDDNFIEAEGINELAKVLKTNVCPKLRELCIGDNSVENQMIHRIFCRIMK